MNPENIREKVIIFQKELEDECYTYGWYRAMQSAAQLYVNNLSIEEENDILYYKMNKYKKESKKLHGIIDSEIKHIMDELTDKIINNEGGESKQSNKYMVKIIEHEN